MYLTKQRGSLGMSIKVENGSTYVRDVFPNGPAAASGMVEKGIISSKFELQYS